MQTMQPTTTSIAERATSLYANTIRAMVETPGNIGKMVVIDVDTGDYGVDTTGFESSRRLHGKRPGAQLFAIRIGYRVAAALGGVMERTVS